MPVCPVCLEALPEGATACPTHLCPPDPLIGEVLAGAYCIERCIGQGGMGRVYAGEDTRLGRKVAIKVMMPVAEERERTFRRFQREARAIAALGHQHIVTVHDIGQVEDGQIYLVMEYLPGETLQDRIGRMGQLLSPDVASIVAQTAKALGVAHREGMVHRDLKPENIMLIVRDDRDDFVKILDFGLAKPYDPDAAKQSMVTQVGVAMGTPAYMSPEQARGLDVDHRSDIYALGMVTYHMLCGRPAFEGPPQAVSMAQVMEEPPPPKTLRPELSDQAQAVLLKCLAKRPGSRFGTADEFAAAFVNAVAADTGQVQAILGGPGASMPALEPVLPKGAPGGRGPLTGAVAELRAPPTTLSGAVGEVSTLQTRPHRRRLWPAFAVVGALVLGAGGAAGVLLSRRTPSESPPAASAGAAKKKDPSAREAAPPAKEVAAAPTPPADAGVAGADTGGAPGRAVAAPPAERPKRAKARPKRKRKRKKARKKSTERPKGSGLRVPQL